MTATDEPMTRWNSPEFQRIVDVQLVDDELDVRFEDGDIVRVARRSVLPPRISQPDWNRLSFDHFEIEVPTDDQPLQVSWLDIRVLGDTEFASYLAEEAEAEARRIGMRLKSLREARNLTSKELAERAGITPQSLSRIEHGRHDVVFTTLQRLLAAMGHDLYDLAAVEDPPLTKKRIERSLRRNGLDARLVTRLVSGYDDQPDRIASRLRRIFGWSIADFLEEGPLTLRTSPAFAGRFKPHMKAQPAEAAYLMYAHYLSLLVAHAVQTRAFADIARDPWAIREEILSEHREVSFLPLLQWVWSQGVPVLPLSESGQFHGACWRTNGSAVICLKQQTPLDSRWTYDLAHELGHVALHLQAGETSVVEFDEIVPFEETDVDEEAQANAFADALLLGNTDELAQEATSVADGRVEYLKRSVTAVARRRRVDPGVLANYMAYRLSLQGINWWGAATNLQRKQNNAAAQARDHLRAQVNWDALASDDLRLLEGALEEVADDD